MKFMRFIVCFFLYIIVAVVFCISCCFQECQGLWWCHCQLYEAGRCSEADRIVCFSLVFVWWNLRKIAVTVTVV